MTSELKACPFCGGSASLHTQQGARWIRCQTCGAETADAAQDESVAAFSWNRRAPSHPARSVAVARLVEACNTLRSWPQAHREWPIARDDFNDALAAVEKEIGT